MRGIWSRLDRLKGSKLKIWPSEDGKKLRIYGFSADEALNLANEEILKRYKEGVESGEIELDDSENYSSTPAGYYSDSQQNSQDKGKELTKAIDWFSENKPREWGYIFSQKRSESDNNRLLAKGDWDGSGYLYRLNVQKERVKEGRARTGGGVTTMNFDGSYLNYSIKGSNLETSLSGDMKKPDQLRLNIDLGKDTLVFTRF